MTSESDSGSLCRTLELRFGEQAMQGVQTRLEALRKAKKAKGSSAGEHAPRLCCHAQMWCLQAGKLGVAVLHSLQMPCLLLSCMLHAEVRYSMLRATTLQRSCSLAVVTCCC